MKMKVMYEEPQGHSPEVGSCNLTTEQLAVRWRKPRTWIYANREREAIPALKIGRHYRYPLDAIMRWEKAHAIEAEGGLC